VALLFALIVSEGGVADKEKSVTFNVTVAVCVRVPLVPVTVRV